MKTQILVHIAAPTTRKDDDDYRNLAEAYSQFEPATVNRISTAVASPGSSGEPNSTQSYGSFPSCNSMDVSRERLQDSQAVGHWDEMDDSYKAPSRYLQLERVQENWQAKITQASSAVKAVHNEGSGCEAQAAAAIFIDDTQLAAQAIQSQLFQDFSFVSAATTEPNADSANNATFADYDPALPAENSQLLALQSQLANHISSEPSPLVIQEATVDRQGNTASPFRLTNDFAVFPSSTAAQSLVAKSPPVTVEELFAFNGLPTEVLPPAPPTGIERIAALPTHKTMYLETILQQNQGRFKPVNRSKLLNADERGYWAIDSTRWSRVSQRDFWNTLSDCVREGKLGWGVFLYREPPPISQEECSLGQIRLYCWGGNVEETWLAAWLCSSGKLVGSKARWFDADENPVLETL